MSKRYFGYATETVKIGVAAWSVTWIEPWVASWSGSMPAGLNFLIAALIAGFVVHSLTSFLGWPRIQVSWSTSDGPANEIALKINERRQGESQPFELRIIANSGGGLGYFLLKKILKDNSTLKIIVEKADATPTCDRYSSNGTQPAVIPCDSTNGFDVHLSSVPSKPGSWHYATVRWRNKTTPPGDEFNVIYKIENKNWLFQFLLNYVVWTSSNAHTFRVLGK